MPGKAWTREKEDELRGLASSGALSAAQMSIKLGVSRNSVIAKMQRLGVPSLFNEKLRESSFGKIQRKKKIQRDTEKKKTEKRSNDFSFLNNPIFHSPTIFSKKLSELQPSECRWPVEDNGKISTLFCAKHACGTYCTEHATKAFDPKKKIHEIRKPAELLQFVPKNWASYSPKRRSDMSDIPVYISNLG